jgi:hypothetical protein
MTQYALAEVVNTVQQQNIIRSLSISGFRYAFAIILAVLAEQSRDETQPDCLGLEGSDPGVPVLPAQDGPVGHPTDAGSLLLRHPREVPQSPELAGLHCGPPIWRDPDYRKPTLLPSGVVNNRPEALPFRTICLSLMLIILLAIPAAAETRLRAASIDAAWIGGAAALDLWSTDHALSRCPTCYEGHPLMRGNLPARVGIKLAMTGVGVAWADHLRQKGDRRGARLVRWGLVGLQVGFAAWNLHQTR